MPLCGVSEPGACVVEGGTFAEIEHEDWGVDRTLAGKLPVPPKNPSRRCLSGRQNSIVDEFR
jgi:hypothetical protein